MSKKNNKKKFIIIIIILLIIFIILLKKFISLKESEVTPNPIGVTQTIYIKDNESKLYPENVFAIVYRYKGNSNLITIYNSLYKFKKYIELLSENNIFSDEKLLQEYYSTNANIVKEYTGLNNLDDFAKLSNEVEKLSKSNKKFEKAIIDINSITEKDDKIECNLDIKYEDVVLSFKFSVLYFGTSSRDTYIYESLY